MPLQELPEEYLRQIESPSGSSLSSNSSDIILINARYEGNRLSESESSIATNDGFEVNVANIANLNNRIRNDQAKEEEETMYQPIKLPTEPTLEELLVRLSKLKLKLK